MMRRIRKAVDLLLPLAGIVLVFGAVLLVVGLYRQLVLVAIGVLLIEAGIWKLAHPLLPSERRYHALRAEVDRVHPLVRDLNAAAVSVRRGDESARPALEDARSELHALVERMVAAAGVEGKEAPGEPVAR